MRKVWVVAGICVAVLGIPTSALAGGGGHGGVCYTEAPELDAGWVGVLDSCFAPNKLSVSAGDTVRWTNDAMPRSHTVTFNDGPDSGPLESTFAVRFNQPGTYRYVCVYHPGMAGSVEVEGDAKVGPALETLDDDGAVLEEFRTTGAQPGANNARPSAMVIQFHPFAAVVILLLGLPVSTATTLRLLGIRRPQGTSRFRWQLPLRREAVG